VLFVKVVAFCRLEAYDRNSNFSNNSFIEFCNRSKMIVGYINIAYFGKPMDMEPEFKMELPKMDTYKDLHGGASIPNITSDSVSTYLSAFDKVIDKPCKDLYELGFINFIRLSHSFTDRCILGPSAEHR